MVLELAQGKEGTAAGYAEYTRLEEAYARGISLILDHGNLISSSYRGTAWRRSATSARGCHWTQKKRVRCSRWFVRLGPSSPNSSCRTTRSTAR
eukprot:3295871-Prymnesium_polylepis.1